MSEAERRFLIFSMRSRLYAFDLSQIAEVAEPPVTWPIPSAPASYVGAMNFHGTIVAVMDLMVFMGITGGQPAEKVLVLDTGLASLALLVEHVVRIVQETQIGVIAPQDEGFSTGMFFLPDGDVTLLDASRIVARATVLING